MCTDSNSNTETEKHSSALRVAIKEFLDMALHNDDVDLRTRLLNSAALVCGLHTEK